MKKIDLNERLYVIGNIIPDVIYSGSLDLNKDQLIIYLKGIDDILKIVQNKLVNNMLDKKGWVKKKK